VIQRLTASPLDPLACSSGGLAARRKGRRRSARDKAKILYQSRRPKTMRRSVNAERSARAVQYSQVRANGLGDRLLAAASLVSPGVNALKLPIASARIWDSAFWHMAIERNTSSRTFAPTTVAPWRRISTANGGRGYARASGLLPAWPPAGWYRRSRHADPRTAPS